MQRHSSPLFDDIRASEAFFADPSDPFEGDPTAAEAWLTDCLVIETRLRHLLSSGAVSSTPCLHESTHG